MRLRGLEATFLRIIGPGRLREVAEGPDGADGVRFLCPKCFAANGGPVGTHAVVCWFAHVGQEESPNPGRWQPEGTSLDDLTFVGPGAASVLITHGCQWHGFIRNGDAT